MKPFLFALALLSGYAAGADDIERRLNWETIGAPTYVNPALPDRPSATLSDDYSLPPADATVSTAAGSIFVREFRVTGVTAFSDDKIRSLTAPYENRQITPEELQGLRLALSRLYVDNGYVSSGVVVPDQHVRDGIVELHAMEGSLSRVELGGDPRLRKSYVDRRLGSIATPLDIDELRTALQRLRLDPRIERLDARLTPGDELGQSVLRLEVVEPPPFEVALSADNHNSSSVGAEEGRVTLLTHNLTGFGDEFIVSGSVSDGSNDSDAWFSVPVTRWNTSVQAYYTASDSDIVEDAFKSLDIQSETYTVGATVTQPFIDTLTNTVSAVVGFEAKHSESTLGGEPFSFSPGAIDGESDTSVLLFGADWLNRGTNHVFAARTTWRKGIDALDATINPQTQFNPTGADGEFNMVLTQALFRYRMNQLPLLSAVPDRGQLVLRGVAQFSADPLMSLEKIAIGGANTVRGYPENLLVRDNGVAATIELQFPVWGYRGEPHLLNLVVAPFIDYGRSWDEKDTDVTSTVRDTDHARRIVGAGVGAIWQPFRGLLAQVYWGADLWDDFDDDDPRDVDDDGDVLEDGSVYFSIVYGVTF